MVVETPSGPGQSIATAPLAPPSKSGTGGTYVQTPEGLKFQPGQTPDNFEEEKKKSFWDRLTMGWKTITGNRPNEVRANEYLAEGQTLFAEKRYDRAAKRFKRASKLWPDSTLEEDAMFLRAEALFFADRYPRSSDTYDNLMKKFENSRHLDTAMRRQFAMGRYWEQLQRARPKPVLLPNLWDETRPMFDTMGNAVAAYDSVRLHDPTGPLADDSVMATANIHFLDESYSDADYYYDILRKDYPKSDYQIPAHILGYRSKLLMYQGPMYDASPLIEARELGKNMLAQFGSQLGEEQERVQVAQNGIAEQLAERDWKMAEFYDQTAHYGAAGRYYNQIVRDHPGTQYVARAQQRLESIKGLPEVPAERLSWLANIFPGEKAKSAARLANRERKMPATTLVADRPEPNTTTQ